MNRGLLLTLTEPPAAMEEEFNAWYDQEHLAERLAIPGFRSATRWVADVPPGAGKYLATYELDSVHVLSSLAYLQRFQNQTPWSRRCLGKAVVFKRWACEQVEPGAADPHPGAKALALNGETQNALQVRRFVSADGERITLCEMPDFKGMPGIVYRLYQP
ncbi:MAG: hypothetical protein K0R40_3734 [Burkholderiales bacterium]|jgi:hypothetical protein|nr:hypothetical protein [Burkholderiales bacterium]